MNNIHNQCDTKDNEDESKSDSTIQLNFAGSITQRLNTSNNLNVNSYPAVQQYYTRKRSASDKNERTNREEENVTKKQRNTNDHFTFFISKNNRNQPIVSLSDSTESLEEQHHEVVRKESIDWLKDFMRQSLESIRETVIQACMTAISKQSTIPFKSAINTRNINVNNHLVHQSDHSLTTPKTSTESWQNQYYQNLSIKKQKNNMLLIDHDDKYIDRKPRIHHRARLSPYPMYKNIVRTLVTDRQVPWSFDWPHYKPTIFTADEIYINPGADPDLLKSSSSISLHFNAIDGAIDRRSVYHHYRIRADDGLPLNPIGRTGLQGRGSLLRWGPNIYHYILICRWKRDIHGRILLHPSNGKKILEILLEIQTEEDDTTDLILTGGLRMIGSHFPPQLQDRLKRFILHTELMFNNRKNLSTSLLALNHLFEQSPIPWKGAYFDDARNTDNAWIELSIEYLFDSDQQLTARIPCLANDQLKRLEQPRFVWKDVQQTMNIGPRTHYRLVQNLADKLDAYF